MFKSNPLPVLMPVLNDRPWIPALLALGLTGCGMPEMGDAETVSGEPAGLSSPHYIGVGEEEPVQEVVDSGEQNEPEAAPEEVPEEVVVSPPELPTTPPVITPAAPMKIALGKRLSRSTKLTGYYPHASLMQGGFKNRFGGRLFSLEAFLAGKAPYVTVALDYLGSMKVHHKKFFCIPALEKAYAEEMAPSVRKKFGGRIPFKVMDTGGAFKRKGFAKLDVCHSTRAGAWDARSQAKVEIYDCHAAFKGLIPSKKTSSGVEIE